MIDAAKVIKNLVFGLFGLIVLFLFLLSVFYTCTVSSDEILSSQKDSPFLHLFFLSAVCLAGVLAFRKFHFSINPKIYYLVLGICLLFMVGSTRLWPKGDAYLLQEIAKHIAEGNYQDFFPEGYLYNQPHQIPFAYVCAIFYSVFGEGFVFVLQGLNCLFLVGIVALLRKIYEKLNGAVPSDGFYLLSLLFVPFFLYATFVYGTLPGLFLVLAGCLQLMKYLECKRYKNAAGAILLAVASNLLKNNYLIFAVAFAAVLLYDFIRKINFRHIAVMLVLAAALAASGRMVTAFTEHLTGVHSKGGIPAVLFAAMGLQEGTLGPGWWSGYHTMVFVNTGCDVERSTEIGMEDLRKSLQKMKEDPAYGADFMLRKISSQWSEPTYESIWIQQNRTSAKEVFWPFRSLFFGGGSLAGIYLFYCNLFQSAFYFFLLFFVAGKWKKITAQELILPVVFIGGFLFHIVWEAKGQYTLPYCVCLLPMCVWGYGFAIKKLDGIKAAVKK